MLSASCQGRTRSKAYCGTAGRTAPTESITVQVDHSIYAITRCPKLSMLSDTMPHAPRMRKALSITYLLAATSYANSKRLLHHTPAHLSHHHELFVEVLTSSTDSLISDMKVPRKMDHGTQRDMAHEDMVQIKEMLIFRRHFVVVAHHTSSRQDLPTRENDYSRLLCAVNLSFHDKRWVTLLGTC